MNQKRDFSSIFTTSYKKLWTYGVFKKVSRTHLDRGFAALSELLRLDLLRVFTLFLDFDMDLPLFGSVSFLPIVSTIGSLKNNRTQSYFCVGKNFQKSNFVANEFWKKVPQKNILPVFRAKETVTIG